jgi:uncharacterized protein YqcC (DUF446 family)
MTSTFSLNEKVKEIKEEMKQRGIWKTNLPKWVLYYNKNNITTQQDFIEWLQFVYLPNIPLLENRSSLIAEKFIVPQAMQFLGYDMQHGKLLQLLIELDSLL